MTFSSASASASSHLYSSGRVCARRKGLTTDDLRLLVELPNDLLRLELLTLLRWGVGKGELLLVVFDPVDPLGPVSRLELRDKLAKRGDDIAQDGDLGFDDLVDVLGLDLKVNDTASALERGRLGSGGESWGLSIWWTHTSSQWSRGNSLSTFPVTRSSNRAPRAIMTSASCMA